MLVYRLWNKCLRSIMVLLGIILLAAPPAVISQELTESTVVLNIQLPDDAPPGTIFPKQTESVTPMGSTPAAQSPVIISSNSIGPQQAGTVFPPSGAIINRLGAVDDSRYFLNRLLVQHPERFAINELGAAIPHRSP